MISPLATRAPLGLARDRSASCGEWRTRRREASRARTSVPSTSSLQRSAMPLVHDYLTESLVHRSKRIFWPSLKPRRASSRMITVREGSPIGRQLSRILPLHVPHKCRQMAFEEPLRRARATTGRFPAATVDKRRGARCRRFLPGSRRSRRRAHRFVRSTRYSYRYEVGRRRLIEGRPGLRSREGKHLAAKASQRPEDSGVSFRTQRHRALRTATWLYRAALHRRGRHLIVVVAVPVIAQPSFFDVPFGTRSGGRWMLRLSAVGPRDLCRLDRARD